jgi:Rps23 Pro-64 3,4-dihydroxylase Tpa1-like proline 4-hydroxylase
MFKWIAGRQSTGYKKLKIFQFLNMDCYLLKYKEGDYIPLHTDPVPGRKHWRLNIELWRANKGGVFQFLSHTSNKWITPSKFNVLPPLNRIYFFRSDIDPHKVSMIEKGTRLVLTFGIAL